MEIHCRGGKGRIGRPAGGLLQHSGERGVNDVIMLTDFLSVCFKIFSVKRPLKTKCVKYVIAKTTILEFLDLRVSFNNTFKP